MRIFLLNLNCPTLEIKMLDSESKKLIYQSLNLAYSGIYFLKIPFCSSCCFMNKTRLVAEDSSNICVILSINFLCASSLS